MTAQARLLVEQALSLCQLGERAPGCGPWPAETWPEWARRAEEWLRAQPVREPVDGDHLVTDEMVERAWTGVLFAHPGPHQHPGEEVLRVVICSVAADLYERGRQDGRGDELAHRSRDYGRGVAQATRDILAALDGEADSRSRG